MCHIDNRVTSTATRRAGAFLLAAALIGTTFGAASAASTRGGDTFDWVATTNNAPWGWASNWSGPAAQVPGPGDTAVFGAVAPVGPGEVVDAVSTIDRAINRLEITQFTWEIEFQGGGGARKTLLLESGDIDAGGILFFNGDLSLNAPGTWNIGGSFFKLNGGLSAPLGFTKTGAGKVILGGFGPGTVQTGPIQLQDGNIEMTGPLSTAAVHTVGDGVGTDGDSFFEYDPGQSTSVGFIVNRNGKLRLQDQSCCDSDTYSLGSITLNGGHVMEVIAGAPTFQFASLGGSAVLDGGVPVPGRMHRRDVRIGGTFGTITVAPLAGFEDDTSLQISAELTAGDLLVTGGGVLEFITDGSPNDNSFGSLTVNDATLLLNREEVPSLETIAPTTTIGDGSLAASARGATDSVLRLLDDDQMDDDAVLTIRSDGELDVNGEQDDIAELHLQGGAVLGGGSLTMLDRLITADGQGGFISAGLGLLGGPNTIDVAGGGTLSVVGQVTGPNADLTKTGNGTLSMANAGGDYGGLTRVESGELRLLFADLPFSIVRLSAGTSLYVDGSTIRGLQGDAGAETEIGLNGMTIDYDTLSPTTYDGDLVEDTTNPAGTFTKTGAGRQNLTGQLNYTGLTDVQEGVLGFAGLGITNSSRVKVSAGATMNIANANNNQVTFQRLTGAGNVVLGDRNLRLHLDPDVNDTFSGEISGSGALRLRGGGTQTLAGGSTYTGETSITQNTTLILANPGGAGSATGPGDVVINNGTLAGDGLINPGPDVNRFGDPVGNDITLTSGTIAPGSPTARGGGTGTLIFTVDPFTEGVLNLDGGVLEFDLGTESDLILFADNGPHLRGTGTTLALNLGPGFSYDNTYTLFVNVTNSDAFFNFANVTGTDGQHPINIFHNPDLNAYQISFTEIDTCPADLDGDGFVNVFDLLELLANWGTDGAGSDLASPNDVVNVFDLLELLSSWGAC